MYGDKRVEGGRPRRTLLESVEENMAYMEIDREHVHDRKKLRRTVTKRKSNPIRKRTINNDKNDNLPYFLHRALVNYTNLLICFLKFL